MQRVNLGLLCHVALKETEAAGVVEKWLRGFPIRKRKHLLFRIVCCVLIESIEPWWSFAKKDENVVFLINSRLAFVVMQTSEMMGLHFLFSAVWKSAAGTKQSFEKSQRQNKPRYFKISNFQQCNLSHVQLVSTFWQKRTFVPVSNIPASTIRTDCWKLTRH